MDPLTRQSKLREAEELRVRLELLDRELAGASDAADWRTSGYYLSYYATTGFFLGLIAAATSLLFNVVGSVAVGQHPLELIRVYLTFGLGDKARDPQLDSGMALAIGCCLYLATGMLLGVPFQVVLSRFAGKAALPARLLWASALGVALWLLMYQGVLSWLQPLLFPSEQQAYIVNLVPWYVGLLTHLVFGWTMAVVYPWGLYEPYRVQSEAA